jgi:L-threonylcarbamoyladenylate synthase
VSLNAQKVVFTDTPANIQKAAELLAKGELVVFPTETVYGLGADACNDRAVASIFEAKGRPSFNPLIVHFPSVDAAAVHVEFNDLALELAKQFWPGPLTLVLPTKPSSNISKLCSAGLPTLAVRVPVGETAQTLVNTFNGPVAAPSANRSGHLSPTTAQHVAQSLNGRISFILDGGSTRVGLESSIVDCSFAVPKLLREGGLSREHLETLFELEIATTAESQTSPSSPGQLLSHYAPSKPIKIDALQAGSQSGVIAFSGNDLHHSGQTLNLSPTGDLVEAASNLFAYLHEMDRRAISEIVVVPIPELGLGRAINDRLRRAAEPG